MTSAGERPGLGAVARPHLLGGTGHGAPAPTPPPGADDASDRAAGASADEARTGSQGREGRIARWTPWVLAALFFAAYTALSLLRYRRMGFQSPDVTVFEQAIRGYAQLGAPVVDIKGPGFNHLGDHFHPLMALMAPAYRLFPGPAILLIQQSALFALSVVPVARAATRRFGTASGVSIGIAYGLAWGLQNAVNFDLHEICFGVPIMAFALEAFLDRRWRACAVWALLLLLVKEDLGVTVALMGALLFLRRQRVLGAAVAVAGVVGFYLTIFVVIPHFNPEGRYPYLDQGGGTDVSPLGLLLEMGDNRTKLWTLVYIFGVTAFLALGSPIAVLTVPTVVWRFHSPNDAYWGTNWHYSAILMPVVFMAMLDVLGRMREARPAWVRSYARQVPAVVVTIAVVLSTQFPFRDFFAPETYQKRDRQESAEAALRTVPDGVVVASDQALLPYIASRAGRLFLIGNTGSFRPEYLIVDSQEFTKHDDLDAWANSLYPDARYTMIFDQDGYEVFRRTR